MHRSLGTQAAVVALAGALAVAGAAGRGRSDPDRRGRRPGAARRDGHSGAADSHFAVGPAQGIAIIPNVLKIGFIAGIRRGHGIVMVRGADGTWTLPQFVILTGGSVGWQAGVQGTDVILVFVTRQSVEGLLRGKFTIGADVAAAAGPVGRNASAATDVRLKAEILSYSRSRGLFAGLALDGSVIEIDPVSQTTFYGRRAGTAAGTSARVGRPAGDRRLRTDRGTDRAIADGRRLRRRAAQAAGGPELPAPGQAPMPALAVPQGMTLRESLANRAVELQAIVDDGWRQYLSLPKEVFEGPNPPQRRVDEPGIAPIRARGERPQVPGVDQPPGVPSDLQAAA